HCMLEPRSRRDVSEPHLQPRGQELGHLAVQSEHRRNALSNYHRWEGSCVLCRQCQWLHQYGGALQECL
ncbi:hypothetical protein LTR95_007873, partial [Oleoguttula sp. CCFEE 5521]